MFSRCNLNDDFVVTILLLKLTNAAFCELVQFAFSLFSYYGHHNVIIRWLFNNSNYEIILKNDIISKIFDCNIIAQNIIIQYLKKQKFKVYTITTGDSCDDLTPLIILLLKLTNRVIYELIQIIFPLLFYYWDHNVTFEICSVLKLLRLRQRMLWLH